MSNNASTETPLAGMDGQSLIYNAASDKYLHRTIPLPGFMSTAFYTGTALSAGDTAAQINLNVEYAIRFDVGDPVTFVGIGLEITTATATSLVRLGIRNTAAHCYPGTLIVDAGTIDGNVLGYQEKAITWSPQIGRYWLTATAQTAAAQVRSRNGADPYIGQASSTSQNDSAWFQSPISGALPAAFATSPLGSANPGPKILVRVQ